MGLRPIKRPRQYLALLTSYFFHLDPPQKTSQDYRKSERKADLDINYELLMIKELNGELSRLVRESNDSTGYTWRFTPDNSGVCELDEDITPHPSTEAAKVPGTIAWKLKGVKAGTGSILLELYPPDATSPVETITINVTIK